MMKNARKWVVGLTALATLAVALPPAAVADPDTAAERYGWTDLVRSDDFDGAGLDPSWGVYDGPGHGNNGVRSPERVAVDAGVLRITGTPEGVTGGMAWLPGQLHGRWEARARL